MPRVLRTKITEQTRLAANYGGWVYCSACGETIGYLCYATYEQVDFDYTCACGSHGHIQLDFEDSVEGILCPDDFCLIKNRLCCPQDASPLMTVLAKKLKRFDLAITCKACQRRYTRSVSER